ncbi:MAG: hypothetical protein EP334_09670 [Gammaproteobacteria bacterium]|nr:MAG: hypothetical protein EP334_09670 [Gammaproteobacteria bacterium]
MKKYFYTLTTALVFSMALPALANPEQANGPKDINSIVDVAVEANDAGGAFEGVFDTLIYLLLENVPGRSDITSALDGKGQYTVFAPTDDAFSDLEETLLTLGYCGLDDLGPELVNSVLLYHVAKGRRDASDVLASDQINMMFGGFLQQEAGVLADNIGRTSKLIPGAIDVMTDNGIIHAIDTVVLPLLPAPGPGGC